MARRPTPQQHLRDAEVDQRGGKRNGGAQTEIVQLLGGHEQALHRIPKDAPRRHEDQRPFQATRKILDLLVAIGVRRIDRPRGIA